MDRYLVGPFSKWRRTYGGAWPGQARAGRARASGCPVGQAKTYMTRRGERLAQASTLWRTGAAPGHRQLLEPSPGGDSRADPRANGRGRRRCRIRSRAQFRPRRAQDKKTAGIAARGSRTGMLALRLDFGRCLSSRRRPALSGDGHHQPPLELGKPLARHSIQGHGNLMTPDSGLGRQSCLECDPIQLVIAGPGDGDRISLALYATRASAVCQGAWPEDDQQVLHTGRRLAKAIGEFGGNPVDDRRLFAGHQEAGKHGHPNWKGPRAAAEGILVSLSRHRGRGQHGHLPPRHDTLESGRDRHFRLATARIAHHQPIHGLLALHVAWLPRWPAVGLPSPAKGRPLPVHAPGHVGQTRRPASYFALSVELQQLTAMLSIWRRAWLRARSRSADPSRLTTGGSSLQLPRHAGRMTPCSSTGQLAMPPDHCWACEPHLPGRLLELALVSVLCGARRLDHSRCASPCYGPR